jgi:hypothetical protein
MIHRMDSSVVRRRAGPSLAVLVMYIAISFAYFGWRLLPHPGRDLVGKWQQNDADIFVWSFAWWPHAILHGANPYFTRVVYAPTGINLAWVTSVPGLAIPFSPITLLFGPDVSYNVAAVLLPALSAWTAYLLCRYVTRSTWASVVGGYLYGFSSYVLGHQFAGHLNLTSVFLVPLMALVILRYVRGDLGARGLAWRVGLLIALQAYISTEISITATLMLLLGLALAFAVAPEARPRIRSSLRPLAAGYLLAGVLAAPLVYYAVSGLSSRTPVFAGYFDTDLLNIIVPTPVTGVGGQWFAKAVGRWPGGTPERGAYLGLPLLLIVTLLVLRRPRSAGTRFLLGAFAIATLFSLGNALYVNGHRIAWMPWAVPSRWPVLDEVLPSRFSVYAILAVAVMAAIWIATTRGALAYVLPILAVAALIPPVWRADDVFRPDRWAFFSQRLYKVCIPRGETLMVFPFGRWGESMLWQAETGFWFKIAEGTLGHNNQPKSFVSDPTVNELLFAYPDTRPSMEEIRALADRRRVDRIVTVAQNDPFPDGTDMHFFGQLQVLGDVFVSPACGYTSLAGDSRPPP